MTIGFNFKPAEVACSARICTASRRNSNRLAREELAVWIYWSSRRKSAEERAAADRGWFLFCPLGVSASTVNASATLSAPKTSRQ